MMQVWGDSGELVKTIFGLFPCEDQGKKQPENAPKMLFSPWSVNSLLQFSQCPVLKPLELQRGEFVTSPPKSVTAKGEKHNLQAINQFSSALKHEAWLSLLFFHA